MLIPFRLRIIWLCAALAVAIAAFSAQPAWSDYQAGLQAYRQGDIPAAMREWQSAADAGDKEAQYALGILYKDGQGVAQDYSQSFKWFEKAAKQGHPRAQYALSALYSEGLGVAKNASEAIRWSIKAAERGNPAAQFNLGTAYALGENVEEDLFQAYKWMALALVGGFDAAREQLNIIAKHLPTAEINRAIEEAKAWTPCGDGGRPCP